MPVLLVSLVACQTSAPSPSPSSTAADSTAPTPTSSATSRAAVPSLPASVLIGGNAIGGGMTKKENLPPLAKSGEECKRCAFNDRCALLDTSLDDTTLPCCDYVGGSSPDEWEDDAGRAARCLAHILGAPYRASAKTKEKLRPLAIPDEECRECFFNSRCNLVVDSDALTTAPCCDYVHGKAAAAWENGDPQAARCLARAAAPSKR